MPYATDHDLTSTRSGVSNLALEDFEEFHVRAEGEINSDIDLYWYRQASKATGFNFRETPFDPTYLGDSEVLTRCAVYLTLSLVYENAALDNSKSIHQVISDKYRTMYTTLFEALISAGLDYDWSRDGSIDSSEIGQSSKPYYISLFRV